jgi:hypothetical protein
MQRIIAYLFILILLVIGCRKEIQKTQSGSIEKIFTGSYSLIENYEVTEGPHAGFKGKSTYTIKMLVGNSESHIYLFENIANAYNVNGILKGDSIIFNTQKFLYHNDSVTISGKGTLIGDSLFLDLYSGGPAGQIRSVCKAKKMYLK